MRDWLSSVNARVISVEMSKTHRFTANDRIVCRLALGLSRCLVEPRSTADLFSCELQRTEELCCFMCCYVLLCLTFSFIFVSIHCNSVRLSYCIKRLLDLTWLEMRWDEMRWGETTDTNTPSEMLHFGDNKFLVHQRTESFIHKQTLSSHSSYLVLCEMFYTYYRVNEVFLETLIAATLLIQVEQSVWCVCMCVCVSGTFDRNNLWRRYSSCWFMSILLGYVWIRLVWRTTVGVRYRDQCIS